MLWVGAVVVGLDRIWAYSTAPGAQSSTPEIWPGSTLVSRSRDRPTLVMFVHPRCTCTSASLIELQQIAERYGHELSLQVLVNTPLDTDPDWISTSIVARARKIPNVTTMLDAGGTDAQRFGATTSGYVVVYDSSGALQFSGGITRARGHVGDNEGLRGIVAFLHHDASHPRTHATFGCGLHDRSGPAS